MVEEQDVYVRSVSGPCGRLYPQMTANPEAAIYVDRQRLAARALPVSNEATIADVSTTILRTYHTSPSAKGMVCEEALPPTRRLEPA